MSTSVSSVAGSRDLARGPRAGPRGRRPPRRGLRRAGHELHLVGGSVRDALLGRLGDDLDFTTDARPEQMLGWSPGWAEATGTTGIEFGTVGAQGRGLRLEITTFRADPYDRVSRNPVVAYGDQPGRRPAPAGLRHQRDGGLACPATSSPTRTAGCADLAAGCCAPRHAGGVVRATTRCGCCGRPGSPPSSRFAVDRGRGRGDDRDGGRPRPDHRRADAGRVHQAALRRRPGRRAAAAGRHRAGRRGPARAAGAAAGDRRARPAQGRLRAHADRARQGHRDGGRTARTSCCGWPRCCTTSASRRPRRSARTAGSASTTTRWSAPGWSAGG